MRNVPQVGARRAVAAVLIAGGLIAPAAGSASADTATQIVQGTLANTVTITTDPTATADFATFALGANTVSGGQVGVTANVAYTLKVVGLKDNLTKYVAAAYDDATTLTNQSLLLTTLNSGAGVPVASVTVSTTEVTIATGTGLTTDVYDLTHSQLVVVGDSPTTYRNDLTYTAAEVI